MTIPLILILGLASESAFADHFDRFQAAGFCKLFPDPSDSVRDDETVSVSLFGEALQIPRGSASLLWRRSRNSEAAIEPDPADAITLVYQKRSKLDWNFDFQPRTHDVSAARVIKRASIPTILIRNRSKVSFRLSTATMRVSSKHRAVPLVRPLANPLAAWGPVLRWTDEFHSQVARFQMWASMKNRDAAETLSTFACQLDRLTREAIWIVSSWR